jgi:hypothetical protein
MDIFYILGDYHLYRLQTNKPTPWLLVCKRTIPTDRPPLVGEF